MKFTIPKYSTGLLQLGGQDWPRHALAALIFAAVLIAFHFNVLERFELVTYDYRVALKGSRPTDPRIAIIEVSDDSIEKIGRWPWDRSWHAALIQILKEFGAKAVVFDVLFSEASDDKNDTALSKAIQDSGNVYLAEVVDESSTSNESGLLKSLPQFMDFAKGAGHINLSADADGVMRRMALVRDVGGVAIPQMSLRVALDQYGLDFQDVIRKGDHLLLPLGQGKPLRVPLDEHGNLIINWAGRWQNTFAHYSFVEVVSSYAAYKKGGNPIVPLESLRGKICYVGMSATGLLDIRPTPLEPAYPAVGVNLTVLNNLLEKKFITKLHAWQDFLILIGIMLILFPIMRMKRFFSTAVMIGVLALGHVVFASALFIFADLWINIIYALTLILLIYIFITLYSQLSVGIERARLLKLATRDSLTGLYNVGHFKLLLKAEITTIAMRREKSLSIVMSDVDNFKKTNDTYGHVIGDSVLREVGEAFKSNCRALDVAARYGGEEFILMLPGADADIACKIADKIRKAISEKTFPCEGGTFSTTISLGVTRVSPDDRDIEAIVARADRALYEAKHTGKNKVVIASDSPKVSA